MKRGLFALILCVLLLTGCSEQGREWSVTVDGAELAAAAVTRDGTVYIPESELEKAVGVQVPNSLREFRWFRRWVPLYEACEELNVSVLEDDENGRLYLTSGILGWEVPAGYTVLATSDPASVSSPLPSLFGSGFRAVL